MFEKAPLAVGTKEALIECHASLWFILVVVDWGRFSQKFPISMSELALVSIPTYTNLNPIFAHLSFILSFINFATILNLWLGHLLIFWILRGIRCWCILEHSSGSCIRWRIKVEWLLWQILLLRVLFFLFLFVFAASLFTSTLCLRWVAILNLRRLNLMHILLLLLRTL